MRKAKAHLELNWVREIRTIRKASLSMPSVKGRLGKIWVPY